MSLIKIKDCYGVNKDLLASELPPGLWSDVMNVRSNSGFSETRRGIATAYTTPTVIPYFMCDYITTAARFNVQAGIAQVFVDDGTTRTEITRYTDGIEIVSITFVGTLATVTTRTAHGRTSADSVTVFGAFEALYNGTFSITVTGATTFTYTMTGTPGANATTVGQYTYNVQSNFTGAAADRVTGGSFNGVLVLNFPQDGLYYWNGDVTTRLRRVPGLYIGEKFDAVFFLKNYIIGLAPTQGDTATPPTVFTKYPHNMRWGNAAEPGAVPVQWVAMATNDAGDTPQAAEAAGILIDGKSFGDVGIAYAQDARFAVQYIGGNDVFRVSRMAPSDDGVLARGCIANTPVGQVFLSNGDVKIHSGGEATSIADGILRRWLFSFMDSTNAHRSFVVLNPKRDEVWIVFPSYGKTSCDMVAVWNYKSEPGRGWGIFSVPNLTCACTGLVASTLYSDAYNASVDSYDQTARTYDENEYSQNESRLTVASVTPQIGLAETGTTDFGAMIPWYAEKIGISLDDSDTIKVPNRSRPQIDALAGTVVNVYHGTAMTSDAAPTYSGPFPFTVGTSNFANLFARGGRYMAIKYVGTDYQPAKLRSSDIEFNARGRY